MLACLPDENYPDLRGRVGFTDDAIIVLKKPYSTCGLAYLANEAGISSSVVAAAGGSAPGDWIARALTDDEINDLCVDSYKLKANRIKDCIPPTLDKLKFNVDGSVRGKPGPAGIGGVLRNSNGKIMCLFSKNVGIMDSNKAELLAIKKTVQLCVSNPELRGRDIEVVSDSKVAVSWVNNEDFGSIAQIDSIYVIRSAMFSFGSLEVIYDSRTFIPLRIVWQKWALAPVGISDV
ncbi:hypothetical protein Ddye_028058 [Dipteronia dyeriana]|uniref:RNase H type-1 domain-containing protein n=1 Tax=Dipteronia dyeriana TaxID=168575 RepID=A0AAD9WS10_9ROSI|nr:hypothetical protein Ddye_028058 [Dipteronia dyeriana]